jgi:hypothetical protein
MSASERDHGIISSRIAHDILGDLGIKSLRIAHDILGDRGIIILRTSATNI